MRLAASEGPGRGASAAPPAGEDPARPDADRLSGASDAPEQGGPDRGTSTALSASEDPVRLGTGRLSGVFEAPEQPHDRLGVVPNEGPQAPAFPAASDAPGEGVQRRTLDGPSGGIAGSKAPPASPPSSS